MCLRQVSKLGHKMTMNNHKDIIRAYKIGRLNRDEAIKELRRLEPKLIKPVLEIFLSAIKRQNIVEFHPEQNK